MPAVQGMGTSTIINPNLASPGFWKETLPVGRLCLKKHGLHVSALHHVNMMCTGYMPIHSRYVLSQCRRHVHFVGYDLSRLRIYNSKGHHQVLATRHGWLQVHLTPRDPTVGRPSVTQLCAHPLILHGGGVSQAPSCVALSCFLNIQQAAHPGRLGRQYH
jgi:hypothetical protein